jgi:hypothetical protein
MTGHRTTASERDRPRPIMGLARGECPRMFSGDCDRSCPLPPVRGCPERPAGFDAPRLVPIRASRCRSVGPRSFSARFARGERVPDRCQSGCPGPKNSGDVRGDNAGRSSTTTRGRGRWGRGPGPVLPRSPSARRPPSGATPPGSSPPFCRRDTFPAEVSYTGCEFVVGAVGRCFVGLGRP